MKWSNINNSGKTHTFNTRYKFKSSFNGRRFPVFPTQLTEPTEIPLKKNKDPEIYTYNQKDSNKFIRGAIPRYQANPLDTFKFGQGITKEDLLFSRDPTDNSNLVISINGAAPSRVIIHNFIPEYRALLYKDSVHQIAVGEYNLSNFDLREALRAGKQPTWPDELIAKKIDGVNIFTYNLGDGNKSMSGITPISDSSPQDRLKFGEGINLDNLCFSRINDNVIIKVKNDPANRLVLRGFLGPRKNHSRSIQQIEIAGYTKSATDLQDDIMANQQPVWSSFTKIPTAAERNDNHYVPNEQLTNLASQFPNESGSHGPIKYDLPRRLPASAHYASSNHNRSVIS